MTSNINNRLRRLVRHLLLIGGAFAVFFVWTASAQSTEQMFPTPILTNEINGTVKVRDIGDSRLTTYFYTFDGTQGDLFINIRSKNYAGDIDIYTKDGLKPVTKIVIYPDVAETETGRVIYLRKPETLILRLQGRAQADLDAKFVIKFAGGFIAAKASDEIPAALPKVDGEIAGTVRVNSVGTRLPEPVKPPKKEMEETRVAAESSQDKPVDDSERVQAEKKRDEELAKENDEETKPSEKDYEKPSRNIPKVIITDNTVENIEKERSTKSNPPKAETARRRAARKRQPPVKKPEKTSVKKVEGTASRKKEKPADPMANVRLVVYFRDGSKMDRHMTDVLRFSVEGAILTVISKDGSIGRYKMTEVLKVSIE